MSSSSSSAALATNTGTNIEAGISASSPTKIPSEETPFIIGLISDHISKSINSNNSNSNSSNSNSNSNIDTLNQLGNTNETQTKTQKQIYLLSSFCRNNGAFIVVTLVLLVLWFWPSKDVEEAASVMKGGLDVSDFEAVLDNSNIDNNSNNNNNGKICVCYNCKGNAGCCKCDETTCPFGGSINRFDSSCRGRFVLF